MRTNEPPHAHDGYFASSSVESEASDVLSVPVNAQSLNAAEKAPLSVINCPCLDVNGEVWAGVFVRFVKVHSLSVNVNADTLLVRERNAG